jgi:hypothetical protein
LGIKRLRFNIISKFYRKSSRWHIYRPSSFLLAEFWVL